MQIKQIKVYYSTSGNSVNPSVATFENDSVGWDTNDSGDLTVFYGSNKVAMYKDGTWFYVVADWENQ